MSRTSSFSEETGNTICGRLAEGETLREVCRDANMPGYSTVKRWLLDNEEFRAQYARACEARADHWADEIVLIADDASGDYADARAVRLNGVYPPTEQATDPKFNAEHVQRSKLRIDTRKWLMAKAAPKKYGEKIHQEVSGLDGAPLVPVMNVTIGSTER